MKLRINLLAAFASLILAGGLPFAAAAATFNYVTSTSLNLSGGATLTIMAGSSQESLTQTANDFTVTVGAGEAFIVRSPGPTPMRMENDSLLPACNVLQYTQDNQFIVRGPRAVAITPSYPPCSTADASKNSTPLLAMVQPNGGENLASGSTYQIFWQITSGAGISEVHLHLSTDGGQTYSTVITEGLINNGFYNWTVPSMPSTSHARIKLEGMQGSGVIAAVAISQADFNIQGDQAAPAPAPETPVAKVYSFDPDKATRTAASIDIDKSFSLPAYSPTPLCYDGLRIKGKTSKAVYFCGADGKRHGFPNQKIHDSWYAGDFAGVSEVSDAMLASIPLGANVTYRPGVRLVKIQTDPKVYAVAANATLRWVKTEDVALALYGADWNKKVDDVPDAFFTDYKIGDPIE